MTLASLYRWGQGVAVANVAGAYWLAGWRAAAGMSLGIAASAFGLFMWWKVIDLAGRSVQTEKIRASFGGCITVAGFLVKLPLFVGAGFLALKLGDASRTCFLIGLAQVYLALIGWSLIKQADQPS